MEPREIWASLIPVRTKGGTTRTAASPSATMGLGSEHSAVSVLWQHSLLPVVYSTGGQLFSYIRGNDCSNGTSLPFSFCWRVIVVSYPNPKSSRRILFNDRPLYSSVGGLCTPIVSVRADLLTDGSARLIHYLICSLSTAPLLPFPSLPSHVGFHDGHGLPSARHGTRLPVSERGCYSSFTTPQQSAVQGTRSASGILPLISMA